MDMGIVIAILSLFFETGNVFLTAKVDVEMFDAINSTTGSSTESRNATQLDG